MLPSVLPTETDHVPVLADEVLDRLAPRPGETVIDCTFGAGGHSELLVGRLRGEGKLIAIDRDPTVAPYFERLRRTTAAKVRLLHGEFSQVLEQLGVERRARRRDPARPRRLLDAARPARARLLLRRRRSARHAHGSRGRPDRGRRRQRDGRMGARRHLPPLRRGALRAPDLPGDRAAPRQAAVRAHRRSRRDDQAGAARRPRASARGIRPSASSRLSGSRSTTSSARSSARFRLRSRCCARTGGSR